MNQDILTEMVKYQPKLWIIFKMVSKEFRDFIKSNFGKQYNDDMIIDQLINAPGYKRHKILDNALTKKIKYWLMYNNIIVYYQGHGKIVLFVDNENYNKMYKIDCSKFSLWYQFDSLKLDIKHDRINSVAYSRFVELHNEKETLKEISAVV